MKRDRWLVFASVLGLAAVAAAQTPAGLPAASAAPDTAVVRLRWTGTGTAPRVVAVIPDTVAFGGVVAIVLEDDGGTEGQAPAALQVEAPWLEPAPDAIVPELANLPAPRGARTVAPYRVYRVGPWRPAGDDGRLGPVVQTIGRLTDSTALAPVRDPRAVAGVPRWLVILGGALALVALAGWLLRRRRRRRAGWAADLPLVPPAWIAAALALRDLDQAASGPVEGRRYLDQLAGIVRRYLLGRLLLPAEEMTAAELAEADRRGGWPPAQLRGFTRVVAACDEARYAPPAVSALQCRDRLAEVLDLIEAVRIMPVWSPVPAPLLADAEAAWRDLRARHPRRAAVAQEAPC